MALKAARRCLDVLCAISIRFSPPSGSSLSVLPSPYPSNAQAIEKELGHALQKEVSEVKRKLRTKKNKVLNTTHIAGGGVHGFKVREDFQIHVDENHADTAVATRTRQAKKKKAVASSASGSESARESARGTGGSDSARGGALSARGVGDKSARGTGRVILGEKAGLAAKGEKKRVAAKSKYALAGAFDKENIPPAPISSARVTRNGGLKFEL